MVLYQNNCIYKLVHKEDYDNENIYVGSTCNFRTRKCGHKSACNNITNKNHQNKVYQFIRNNGGWEMWDMVEIEKYPCCDKKEAFKKEREIIDQLKPALNTLNPYAPIEEQRETTNKRNKNDRKTNPDKWAERDYINYHRYKDIKLEKRKCEKIVCECGCIVRKVGIYAHRETQKHCDLVKKQYENADVSF